MKLKIKVLFGTFLFALGLCTLEFGASANPLHDAVNTGNTEKVNYLCRLNSGWINQRNDAGDLPINCATTLGTLKCLTKHGSPINAKGSRGRTPLHRFMVYLIGGESEYIDAVNYLLDKGADIGIPDDDGLTPLDLLEHLCNYYRAHGTDAAVTSRLELYFRSLNRPNGRLCRRLI